jgi:hypothetical protein
LAREPGHRRHSAHLTRLLATGVIQDQAIAAGATSQVNPVNLTLPDQGSLTADGLRSWCVLDT